MSTGGVFIWPDRTTISFNRYLAEDKQVGHITYTCMVDRNEYPKVVDPKNPPDMIELPGIGFFKLLTVPALARDGHDVDVCVVGTHSVKTQPTPAYLAPKKP